MGKARELAERGVELFNACEIEQLVATYDSAAVEVITGAEYRGRDAISRRLQEQRTAFPDRRVEPLRWVEEGDMVVLEFSFTGTHTGPLRLPLGGPELPPTGQRLSFSGVSILELRDERCVAHTLYAEMTPVMLQLGVVTVKVDT